MNPIRLVLADDHTLVRAGIRSLILRIDGVQVVGEAADGNEVLQLVKEHHPEIVLMDIAMPGLNGLEATRALTMEYPDTRVIILSMHLEKDYVLRALEYGARGYLLKGARTPELELAIRAVAEGETYLSPAVSKLVVGAITHRVAEPSPAERITPRQRQVLRLIADGRTTKEIALELGLSIKTVKTHRSELMQQLDIHEIAGLVRYAIQIGLVSLPDRPA